MDEKDLEILEYVASHPHDPLKAIAFELGISRITAQRRVSSLMRQGRLNRLLVVDFDSMGYTLHFRIDVNVNLQVGGAKSIKAVAMAIKQLGLNRKFRGRMFVSRIQLLLASATDISVYVRARDYESVFAFVAEELRALDGVQSASAVQAAWTLDETALSE